jgi:hypothetical protein
LSFFLGTTANDLLVSFSSASFDGTSHVQFLSACSGRELCMLTCTLLI